MAWLMGTDKLNKIINDFLEPFEAWAELGSDFSYFYGDSCIWYTLAVPDVSARLFMNHVKSLAPDITCDIFLLSLLHELGHHVTMDLVEDMDMVYAQDMKVMISETIDKNRGDEEIYAAMNALYFNLPDEERATKWAIEYIRNHTNELSAFWNEIQTSVMNIYKINNVEVI